MPRQEFPLTYLQNYLPAASAAPALALLHRYKVHLTITKERKTVLGDYRHAHNNEAHRISVNGNLNQYAFLITLVHELAHLVTFLEYGNRIQAHGREWKHVYKMLLLQFLEMKIFPEDILASLQSSLHNLPASSCADEGLMRVLRRYDKKEEGLLLVEELPEGALFALDDGKVFKKGERLRKRFQCIEVKTGKLYLFSPVYEVKKVS
jgi:SprT protein